MARSDDDSSATPPAAIQARGRQRRRVVALAAVLVALAFASGGRAALGAVDRAWCAWRCDDRALALMRLAARLDDLHERKAPTKPGEWLESHREDGQSFAQFAVRDAVARDPVRTVLYLQPLAFDPAQEGLVDDAADWLERFYGLPVARLPPEDLAVVPETARRREPRPDDLQINSAWVLGWLVPRVPRDAVAVIALTSVDLWPGPGWNFVFGQASLRDRVGVWSLARLGDPLRERSAVLRRMVATATHETGHMLGIRHCIAWECAMNGSNNEPEADSRPLWFCPACVAKVWWSCPVDPARRAQALADSCAARGWSDDERHWREAARRLAAP